MYSTVLSSNNSDVMILSSFSKDRLHLSSLLLSLSWAVCILLLRCITVLYLRYSDAHNVDRCIYDNQAGIA
jgi:hypothetical protein